MNIPIPFVIAKNMSDNQMTYEDALSILDKKLLVLFSFIGLF